MRVHCFFLAVLAASFGVVTSAGAQTPEPSPLSPENRSEAGGFSPVSGLGQNQEVPMPLPTWSGGSNGEVFWAEAEYLLWWMKPVCQKVPILNAGNPGDLVPGAEGQPGSRAIIGILGVSKYELPATSGLRATVGFWLPNCPQLGWDASGFLLQEAQNTHLFQSQNGGPASFVPFIDPNNASQALPFSVPGLIDGRVTAIGSSRLWGADTNLLWRFAGQDDSCFGNRRVTLLLGFRHLNLQDDITIVQTQTSLANPALVATGMANFATRNEFYGAQLGARFELQRGLWTFEATGKFAPGEVKLVSEVSGSPLAAGAPLLPANVPGPLLAFPSNVGYSDTWALSFVEELNLKVRYQLMKNVQGTFGYNLIYLNRIACPGDEMPTNVNVTQLPQFAPLTGKLQPTPKLVHTDYFAQGLTAGLEIRY